MARNRSRQASNTVPQVTDTQSASIASTNTNSNTTKESNKMALTPEQIQELLADNRGRGDYGSYLDTFVASGSPGEEVSMTSGILAGKDAAKIKTGLENAKKSRDKDGVLKHPDAQNILIVKKGEVVFVINRGVEGTTDAAE